ncbi:hypothetical protein [Marivirga sp.]|uniref:hypothetical protein n=1 Tax=Marivirga sp. TaxID=2018662 RepID=UPI002D7E8C07|nr:hypothetical protein [Marivirga sp.]HET8858441.1 hypothetical protein [Marivirga sp.]
MSKILITALVIFSTTMGFTQNMEINEDSIENQYNPLLLLSLSMSSPFETYNSFDVGLMKSLNSNSALGLELGYIYNLQGFNNEIEESWQTNANGLKAYLYFRLFLNNDDNYPPNSTTFIDFEPQFYWMSFDSERIGGFGCNSQFGECEYFRFYDSRVERIIPGINLKIGQTYDYDPLHVTIFAGIGYRYVYEFSEMDNGLVEPDKIFNTRGEESDLQIGAMSRLRLGFQLAYNIKYK